MAKNLVIVESPAKAKTIKKFLGKDFEVMPSYGHVRDLSTKGLGVDIENNYKPDYVIEPEKKKVIKRLKEAAKQAQIVWLATDEDREGEAIAWHLSQLLDLNEKNAKRIVFHEITKSAIKKAIENPRWIDYNLVNAQQARRVLDRLVGFELSELLWKKVKNKLSAGRVQSVAVRLVVEREQEIKNFEPKHWYRLRAFLVFTGKDGKEYTIKADLDEKIDSYQRAKEYLEKIAKASFVVTKLQVKQVKRKPPEPFTTSTLQQEASRKLGFSVVKTMRIAQKLYEEGKITYMRTDSTTMAEEAIDMFKNFIIEKFGPKYSEPKQYKTKIKRAQEAHEAIRPTSLELKVSDNPDEQRLYELIFHRAIASQMAPAVYDKTTIIIEDKNKSFDKQLTSTVQVLKFDGFLKIYSYRDLDEEQEEEQVVPPIEKGTEFSLLRAIVTEKLSAPPSRYNEATLVKKLEELGIGRPSTYAPTIDTIQKRGYVIRRNIPGEKIKIKQLVLENGKITEQEKTENYGAEKNRLVPTDMGIVVTNFLLKYFPSIVDYNFTANVEKDFDEIAAGKAQWTEIIDQFYKTFHPLVEKTTKEASKEKHERFLGKDPDTGRNVYAKIAKYGPVIQLGDFGDKEPLKFASIPKYMHIDEITLEKALELLNKDPNGNLLGHTPDGIPVYTRWTKYGPVVQFGKYEKGKAKPHFINLPKSLNINELTLEQALELRKLPKKLGQYNGKDVILGIGKYGPYILYDDKFYSVSTKYNILTLTLEQAKEIIENAKKRLENSTVKVLSQDPEIRIVKGKRGGLQIYYQNKYYPLSKSIDIDQLTAEEALKIVQTQLDNKKSKSKKSKSGK